MRYNTYINNKKCLEWGLNPSQGAMMDLFNQLHSWAKVVIIDKEVFYFVARSKVVEELPVFYSKNDTVYRHYKKLNDLGLINYKKVNRKDLIQLTDKGKTWNSEMNPSKLGNESESNSEMNPTYNNTNIDNNIKDKIGSVQFDLIKNNSNFHNLSDDLKEKLTGWLSYKHKIKKIYRAEVSINTLIKKFISRADDLDELLEYTYENGYQGIIWDKKLKSTKTKVRPLNTFDNGEVYVMPKAVSLG